MEPGCINQLFLISLFELKRAFATRKGLLFLVTFAVVWYVILLYPLQFIAELLAQDKNFKHGFSLFQFFGFNSVQGWSFPEFGVYWHFALLIFPLLSITLASDQTCSDRERGTLRFIAIRSSRDRLFFGRFLGAMAIQVILISATAFSVIALILKRDTALFSEAMPDFLALIANLTLVILPFTAMMAALSARVRSARQATLWAILIWTFLAGIFSAFSGYLPVLDYLKYLIPGYQLSNLTQLSGWRTLQLAHIPVLQSFVLLALGRWITSRQAL